MMNLTSLLSPAIGLPTLVLVLLFVTTLFGKERVKRPQGLAKAWRMILLSLAVAVLGVLFSAMMNSTDGVYLAIWANIFSSVGALYTLYLLVCVMIDFELMPSEASTDEPS